MKFTDYVGISFIDRDFDVVISLMNRFKDNHEIKIHHGDIFAYGFGSLVSPANCYGNMDGGIDRDYSERFSGIENRLKTFITENHGGKLEFGTAQIVPTGDEKYPHIVFSPTIERPGDLATGKSVYEAMKAVLSETLRFNLKPQKSKKIENLLIPGLGTGYGGLDPEESARNIFDAYNYVNHNLGRLL